MGGTKPMTVLVTGAAGYVGRHVAGELLSRGHFVIGFDRVQADPMLCNWREPTVTNVPIVSGHPHYQFVVGDMRTADFSQICKGVDVVVHTASLINITTARDRAIVHEVNVNGTERLLKTAAAFESPKFHFRVGVQRFIYISSYSVVFDESAFTWRPMENVDETYPYPTSYVDLYSQSKAEAEKLVIAANGKNGMYTCALRPCAIYGPAEQSHIPRIIHTGDMGGLVINVGSASVKTDFVYIDNLVYAVLQAEAALHPRHVTVTGKNSGTPTAGTRSKRSTPASDSESTTTDSTNNTPIAAGQIYHIGDCEPTNTFDIYRPILKAAGHSIPYTYVPAPVMYAIAWVCEWIQFILQPIIDIRVPITRLEVLVVGVTHYFDPRKAQTQLRYFPAVSMSEGQRRTAAYFGSWVQQRRERQAKHGVFWPNPLLPVVLLLGLALTYIVAYDPAVLVNARATLHVSTADSISGYTSVCYAYVLDALVMCSEFPLVIRGIFIGAWLTHLVEAAYVYTVCRKAGIDRWLTYVIGATVVGFPFTMKALHARDIIGQIKEEKEQ